MEKVVKITKLKDRQSDYSYWVSKSEIERLSAIELLREQYLNYTENVQQGFQRVCRVINKAQG